MKGDRDLQNFVNVHFRSKEFGRHMMNEKSGGMLYFIYNKDLISVLVCHDIEQGEFVLQVPYYPPIESMEMDYTKSKCLELVQKTMVSAEFMR